MMTPIKREYALAALRSAGLYARLLVNQADQIGLAVKDGLVSPEEALLWARDVGVLEFVAQNETENPAPPAEPTA
jgi:hypothetical protein